MTRLEEIKNKYGGTFLLHVKKDSPGEDILWLIDKLEKAIEMAKFYKDSVSYDDETCIFGADKNDYGKWIFDYGQKAEEFLKELE